MITEYNSYAKINIGLHILRKRDDGYHDIETTFKLIDLHDRIQIEPAKERSVITSNRSDVPTDEANIALKAVRLLERKTGKALHVRIHIEKNIPMGAGLGGGSSNGATVLTALNNLFQLNLSGKDLLQQAALLGSDVPFFTGFMLGLGTTAFGQGRGERLEFFRWNLSEKVILVYPKTSISTAWAYQNYKKYKDLEASEKTKNTLTNRGVSVILSAPLTKKTFFDNDFEPLVFANHDQIRLLRQSLAEQGAVFSSLSGSGSTVFGLFESDADLAFSSDWFPGTDVYACNFVN